MPPNSTDPIPHLDRYRPDIDGLRAIAVMSVLFFHIFATIAPSGFVGVDIFFVISGYLITGIINESLSSHTFTISNFYVRRIKRILPSLLLVLTSVLLLGGIVLINDEMSALGKHLLASAMFISNFVLWKEVGYFDIQSNLKPLLHLWSLGVEEQFYIIWPILLFICWKRRINFLYPTILIIISSFIFNYYRIITHPSEAFYLPFGRFWELLFGAFLTFIERQFSSSLRQFIQNKYLQNILSFVGIFLILYSILKLAREPFPGTAALYPVLGAIFILLASESLFNKKILANRLVVYIGLISYPLYLWHWPLLAYARIVESGVPNRNIRIGIFISSILLAILTYELIEKKIRFNLSFAKYVNQRQMVTVLMIGLIAIGIIGQLLNTELIDFGLLSVKYKHTFSHSHFNLEKKCKDYFPFASENYCSLSSDTSQPQVVVLGDSHALHYFAGLQKYYFKQNKDIVLFGKGGCPPLIGIERLDSKSIRLECDVINAPAINYAVHSKNVETIILGGSFSSYLYNNIDLMEDQVSIPAPNDYLYTFKKILRRTLKVLQTSGKKIVYLEQVPIMSFDPKNCVRRPFTFTFKAISDCSVDNRIVLKKMGTYRLVVSEILNEFPNVAVYYPEKFLCDAGVCFAEINGEILYSDNNHLNEAGSLYLANTFKF